VGARGSLHRPDLVYRGTAKVRTAVIPPQGLLYSNVKAPLTAGETSFGPKRGRATSHQIGLPPLPFPGLAMGLDLFGWGDSSKQSAAANGGLARVEHMDYELQVYLFVYRRFTTEAYGN
jgi:hypothetical protein